MFAETFHKVLVVRETKTVGAVFIVISEGKEHRARIGMLAKLVHTAKRPLTGAFEFAANTLAARYFDRNARFRLACVKDKPARLSAGFWAVGR